MMKLFAAVVMVGMAGCGSKRAVLEESPIYTGSLATDCKIPPDDPKKPCDKNQPSRKALEHKEKP